MSGESNYRDGDVVWVKLGPSWWPGQVVDKSKVPEDVTFKKEPLAIVKFFEEDSFEYVKSANHISYYTCGKKNDYIRKGMDAFRAKHTHMENFPRHVCLAETLTNGNPDILSLPEFSPQKKRTSSSYADLFGRPTPKKSPKATPTVGRPPKGKSSTDKSTPKGGITHRRFLGYDDHEVIILPQTRTSTDSAEDESKTYSCPTCRFKTKRLEVIMMHNKSHIQGVYNTPLTKKPMKHPFRKMDKAVRTKTKTFEEDLERIKKGLPLTCDLEPGDVSTDNQTDDDPDEDVVAVTVEKSGKKGKVSSAKKAKKPKVVDEEVKEGGSPKKVGKKRNNVKAEKATAEEQAKIDIVQQVLSSWSDDESEEEEIGKKPDAGDAKAKPTETEKSEVMKKIDSCFDFSEEEEEVPTTQTSGRKIPRVIPVIDKQKPENSEETKDLNSNSDEMTKVEENLDAFMDILESTKLSDLPEIPNTLKSEQNFHSGKMRKVPDKEVKEETNKLINPKKRFVKSFEDFEMSLNEQKKSAESENNGNVKKNSEKLKEDEKKNDEKFDKLFEETKDKKEEKPVNKRVTRSTRDYVTYRQTRSGRRSQKLEDEEKDSPKTADTIENLTPSTNTTDENEPEPEKPQETSSKLNEIISTIEKELNETLGEPKPPQIAPELPDEPIETAQKPESPLNKSLEVLKLKSQLMSKLKSDLPVEQTTPPKVHQTRKSSTDAAKSPVAQRLSRSSPQKVKSPEKSPVVESPKKSPEIVRSSPQKAVGAAKRKSTEGDYKKTKRRLVDWEEDMDLEKDNLHVVKEVPKETLVVVEEKPVVEEEPQKIEETVATIVEKKEVPVEVEEEKREHISAVVDEKREELTTMVEAKIKGLSSVVQEKIEETSKIFGQNLGLSPRKIGESSSAELFTMTKANTELPTTFLEPPVEPNKEETVEETQEDASDTKEVDMSALATLATVSELSTTLDTYAKPDKNVTVLTEKELDEGQVEIASVPKVEITKPMTLSSFSMDFSEEFVAIDKKTCKKDKLLKQKSPEPQKKENTEDSNVDKPTENGNKTKPQDVPVDLEDQIPPSIVCNNKTTVESEMAILTDTNPDTETVVTEVQGTSSKKLLEILTDTTKPKTHVPVTSAYNSHLKHKVAVKGQTFAIASEVKPVEGPKILNRSLGPKRSKPIILSEKVIKPSSTEVSVQKVTSKRTYQDVEDIDTFIIQKPLKRVAVSEQEVVVESNVKQTLKQALKKSTVISKGSTGKAKILQQTIITPSGDIIQPNIGQADDNNMFDINSMPIVLSDQILTPENIDTVPIVFSDSSTPRKLQTEKTIITSVRKPHKQLKLLTTKPVSPLVKKEVAKPPQTTTFIKTFTSTSKPERTQKLFQMNQKVLKSSPAIITQSGKPGKFLIIPSEDKRVATKRVQNAPGIITKVHNIAPEPSGNKIMIVTNQQGQQSRVLLTPAQQKLLGYQTKIKVSPKTMLTTKSTTLTSQSASHSKGVVQLVESPKTSVALQSTQNVSELITIPKSVKKVQNQRVLLQALPRTSGLTKTRTVATTKPAIIKSQPVQSVRKLQDDALLDQQVQEQIQAIKAAKAQTSSPQLTATKQPPKRSYAKKPPEPQKPLLKTTIRQKVAAAATASPQPTTSKAEISMPPLAPISPSKKPEPQPLPSTSSVEEEKLKSAEQRPLNQLVIQDSLGNQTTITEGQILALPSETVDGQPQSYMLVTVDESGNLTPLNNEALMSLDPNLAIGGDLSNIVLQVNQETAAVVPQVNVSDAPTVVVSAPEEDVQPDVTASTPETVVEEMPVVSEAVVEAEPEVAVPESATCSLTSEPNQQLIVTGDPVAAQKLLESLTDGNSDLANILANAEGSILIQADGQQILINTDSENRMMLTVNPDSLPGEVTTDSLFSNQPPTKSQDILAAALADTDVFQQEPKTQLSPNNTLYPMNTGNVLETSLTLNSPIMTPLEIPTTNTKKIPDSETDILTHVPKNVDLPITITDPNISQTVAHQQVASMIAGELQANLELPLSIADPSVSLGGAFSYSLPSLVDDVSQKSYTNPISMPLLSEEPDELVRPIEDEKSTDASEIPQTSSEATTVDSKIDEKSDSMNIVLDNVDSPETAGSAFEDEGLCTLGRTMCSSLSEPPPDDNDMFDLSVVSSQFNADVMGGKITDDFSQSNDSKEATERRFGYGEEGSGSNSGGFMDKPLEATNLLNDENSCEIPVQPEIVTDLAAKSFSEFEMGDEESSKRGGLDEVESENKRFKLD